MIADSIREIDASANSITPEGLELLLKRLADSGSLRELDLDAVSDERRPVFPGGTVILAEIIATPWPALAPSGPRSEAAGVSPAIALDPICRMEVEVEDARHTYEVNGRTYYFCCAGCRAAFAADPAAALAATGHA